MIWPTLSGPGRDVRVGADVQHDGPVRGQGLVPGRADLVMETLVGSEPVRDDIVLLMIWRPGRGLAPAMPGSR